MLGGRWQWIPKQAPAVRIILRPSSLASEKLDRFLPRPFATVHVCSENLRCALVESGQQVPQFYCIELNWSGGAEDHVLGVARYRAKKLQQFILVRWITPLQTARCSRFVSLVEDHNAKGFLYQCTSLAFVIAHDNKAGRHNPNEGLA